MEHLPESQRLLATVVGRAYVFLDTHCQGLGTSAALTGVEQGVAVEPVGSCGVKALLSNGEQVVLV